MSHQLGFLQHLKASFTFCATKHSRDFCFTSVIAYNSMKLQAELVSLAADKQNWECGTVLVPGEGGRVGGWQPLVSHSSGLSLGYPSGKAVGSPEEMDAAGLHLVVMEVAGQKGLVKGLKLGINTWLPCPGHPQLLLWELQFWVPWVPLQHCFVQAASLLTALSHTSLNPCHSWRFFSLSQAFLPL